MKLSSPFGCLSGLRLERTTGSALLLITKKRMSRNVVERQRAGWGEGIVTNTSGRKFLSYENRCRLVSDERR